jgi:acetyltransferase-like isoleucine patch superfamily enzyme
MGTNAVVVPGKSVGRGSQIAAGSVVYNNVDAGHMALGNPARARKLATSKAE